MKLFEYLLKTTPPEELRRQLAQLHRWLKWMLWRARHPRIASFLDGAFYAGMILGGR